MAIVTPEPLVGMYLWKTTYIFLNDLRQKCICIHSPLEVQPSLLNVEVAVYDVCPRRVDAAADGGGARADPAHADAGAGRVALAGAAVAGASSRRVGGSWK